MDSKLYIEWRESLRMYVVKYRGSVISQHDVQDDAEQWVKRNYPGHGYEIERVIVRSNSPRGVKVGEWR
jgi:hypothetical protein